MKCGICKKDGLYAVDCQLSWWKRPVSVANDEDDGENSPPSALQPSTDVSSDSPADVPSPAAVVVPGSVPQPSPKPQPDVPLSAISHPSPDPSQPSHSFPVVDVSPMASPQSSSSSSSFQSSSID